MGALLPRIAGNRCAMDTEQHEANRTKISTSRAQRQVQATRPTLIQYARAIVDHAAFPARLSRAPSLRPAPDTHSNLGNDVWIWLGERGRFKLPPAHARSEERRMDSFRFEPRAPGGYAS